MNDEITDFERFRRATNYLTAAQIFLQDNFLLERPLTADDIKPRLLGHWGSGPGVNLIYAHLNKLVKKYGADCSAFDAIGYREVVSWNLDHGTWNIQGPGRRAVAELITKNTIAYAKRQMTWFKKDTGIHWIAEPETAVRLVARFLEMKRGSGQ